MFTLKLKIGKSMLEAQFNTMKPVHEFCSVYGALPSVCDACQSDDIYLSHKSPKDNDYYTIVCKSCGAELALHQKKDGKGFYIKRGEKMEVYQAQVNQQPTQNQQPVQQTQQQMVDPWQNQESYDDVPF